MNLGCRLYGYRKSKNLSQEEVAFALNVTRQTVSKWETGQSTPDFDKIVPICELYGITTDELINGDTNEEVVENNGEVTTNTIIDDSTNKKKKAKGIVTGIISYVVAIAWIMVSIPVLGFNPVLCSAIFLLICAAATGVLIYSCLVYKTAKKELTKEQKLIKQITDIVAVFFTVIYFLISFLTMAWHITWILWIICGLVNEIIKLIIMLRSGKNEE